VQAPDDIVPVLRLPGEDQGMLQVGFLDPQRRDRVAARTVVVLVIAAELGQGMSVGADRASGSGVAG
jgi:hypothetical protein